MPTKRRRGKAAEHAIDVLPREFLMEVFGFRNDGSLRKLMSRHGVKAVHGYSYEDVKRVYGLWDPERAWDRSPYGDESEEEA